MVEKRCAKGAQKSSMEKTGQNSLSLHSYPDKIAITNLLCRGSSKQLKGGYKR